MVSAPVAGFRITSFLQEPRVLGRRKHSSVTTFQRITTFIDRINRRPGAGETIPAEFHAEWPQMANQNERPVIVGYSVWPL